MPLIDWTQHKAHPLGKRNCRVYSWPLTAGDTYVPLPVGGYQDVTVYFTGSSAGPRGSRCRRTRTMPRPT